MSTITTTAQTISLIHFLMLATMNRTHVADSSVSCYTLLLKKRRPPNLIARMQLTQKQFYFIIARNASVNSLQSLVGLCVQI